MAAMLCAWAFQAGAVEVQVTVQDSAGKPLPGAVVFLESAEARKLARPLSVQDMAQQKRRFVPEVLVVTVGTEVQFPNRDTVRHHVYSFSPAKKFELQLYSGTPANPVLFDRPGVVVLGCNIHDQMVAWILVLETPFFAQGGSPFGSARIDKVPAGAYTLRVWHAGLAVGALAYSQPLTVAEGAAPVVVRLAGVTP
ncbi:methylamine utilization protein [Acidovorax sp. SUPP3334]|uniref:methylamine utilization protein n=1 Tax=Acidovorax sp. SUPP3334 TaxID=2920881 RepID=UPI0024E06F90|nr:methylamine utilization protein [Acidovorax sp. SUPP3334]